MLESSRSEASERAKVAAQRRADDAREEFGRMAFDALEEYFPEQAKERRREDGMRLFLVGLVVGFLLRSVLGRWTRSTG